MPVSDANRYLKIMSKKHELPATEAANNSLAAAEKLAEPEPLSKEV
jgi:hypothetical protein